jgi:hypothetical protein
MTQVIDWTYVLRGGTALEWLVANPVLLEKEPGVETDTRKFKIGDGVHLWSELPYYVTEDAVMIMISEAMTSAVPITPAQIDAIVEQVKSELTLPDLVQVYEDAKV